VKPGSERRYLLDIHFGSELCLLEMNTQDVDPPPLVRPIHQHLPIEAARGERHIDRGVRDRLAVDSIKMPKLTEKERVRSSTTARSITVNSRESASTSTPPKGSSIFRKGRRMWRRPTPAKDGGGYPDAIRIRA
jgi:hypothetical protein